MMRNKHCCQQSAFFATTAPSEGAQMHSTTWRCANAQHHQKVRKCTAPPEGAQMHSTTWRCANAQYHQTICGENLILALLRHSSWNIRKARK